MRLQITGVDPQLYLPPLALPDGQGAVLVTLRIRVTPSDGRSAT
jgi:hypothetical protein